MPQATFNITPNPVSQSSSYTAYMNQYGTTRTSAASVDTKNFTFTFSGLSIPAGSTVDSAYFIVDSFVLPAHGTAVRRVLVNNTQLINIAAENTQYAISNLVASGDNTVTLVFQSAKDNTNYPVEPPASGESSRVNIGSMNWNNPRVVINYTLPYSKCTAPTSITVAANNVAPNSTVKLSWSGATAGTNNPIKHYEVFRSTTSGSGYTSLTTTTATSLNVTSPATNSSYYYKIKTIGTVSGYDSDMSSQTATLTTLFSAPSVPGSVAVNPASVGPSGSATLSWAASSNGSNNTVSGYKIERASASAGPWEVLVSSQTARTLAVTGQASNGSAYYYRVTALAPNGNSGASATATLTTEWTNPSAPTTVSVNTTNVAPGAAATLSWSGAGAGTNNAITKYEVHRSPASGSGYTLLQTVTGTSLSVTSPTSNGSYYYKIITVGTVSGTKSALSTATATLTTSSTAPSVPGSPSINKNNVPPSTNATLSWSASSNGTNNPFTGYTIQRATSTSGPWTDISTNQTATTLTVTSTSTNGTYYYRIIAVGTYYNSAPSATVSYTTSYSAPSAPSSVTLNPASVGPSGSSTLSWAASSNGTNNAVSGYKIERATSASGTWSVLVESQTART